MILGSFIDKLFGVIDDQTLTKALQRLMASKGIGKVNRALACMALDMGHLSPRQVRLYRLGIDPAIAPKKVKDDAFASRTSSPLHLTSAAKVGLIELNLTRELGAFQFCDMKEHHPQFLMHPSNSLGIQAQITSQSLSWLLLIKALQDNNLAAQLSQTFLLTAEHAFNIATRRLYNLKRRTKNTFATIQKVGHTTKNRICPSNHQYLQGCLGYETP